MSKTIQIENGRIEEDGLLHCTICGEPKETMIDPRYHHILRMDRHYRHCECERKQIEKEEAERKARMHREEVERLRRAGFSNYQMRNWTFANDNGKNPQMEYARDYVDNWPDMLKENRGLLLWGGVGAGKSFFAGCIANALIEKEVPVLMTNFAEIINELMSWDINKNEYIRALCRYSLLIIDDLGMERNTDFGLEQVYNVIDSRWRAQKPLIVTTNLTIEQIQNPPDLPHQRIYDRVCEMCVPVKIHGESMRAEKAKQNMESFKQMIR